MLSIRQYNIVISRAAYKLKIFIQQVEASDLTKDLCNNGRLMTHSFAVSIRKRSFK